MKWACLLLVGLVVSGVSAELLETLDNLVQSQWYHSMSEQNQVYLMDMLAAAETCKLKSFTDEVGRANLADLYTELTFFHPVVMLYISTHESQEALGTCTVQQ